MKSLYAISIKGTMLYVKGDLTEQECFAVEALAKHFLERSDKENCEDVCHDFIQTVYSSLNIVLVQEPVKYVFRIL